jgi:pimeloyl-ACP methyl ester carboxylesterase
MIKSVSYVVEIVEQLGWQKFNALGHSMGASIALMYSSAYPERVDSLILIEGLGPMSSPASSTVRNVRKAIDSERKFATKTTSTKLYSSLDDAISARLNTLVSFPGKQTLSHEAARILVSRSYLVTGYSNINI